MATEIGLLRTGVSHACWLKPLGYAFVLSD